MLTSSTHRLQKSLILHIYTQETAGADPFHREPYIAFFKALGGDFDVTFIVFHTYPDEATEEINGLGAVFEYALGSYPDEADFIVMGNLNADGSIFNGKSGSILGGNFQ